jgi:molybdenum cofactor biosynthesis enzyme MoaA
MVQVPLLATDAPVAPLSQLDQLWFQVGGTRCNLTCKHCFIACSPHNHSFTFLSLAEIERWLIDSVRFGVKEYYFTGGEPFLNPDMPAILGRTLQFGAATVLTNGTVLKDEWLDRLRLAENASIYSLEFRVSIDGFTAEQNDPIRGDGVFDRAVAGVGKLVEHGFLPIITVAQMDESDDAQTLYEGFVKVFQSAGYARPRIKILPALRLGAEVDRCRGYREDECVTKEMLANFDMNQLLCTHSRIVTDRGVHVCPILIESPDSFLGDSLGKAQIGFPLRHHACYTCWQFGSICSNPSASLRDA